MPLFVLDRKLGIIQVNHKRGWDFGERDQRGEAVHVFNALDRNVLCKTELPNANLGGYLRIEPERVRLLEVTPHLGFVRRGVVIQILFL